MPTEKAITTVDQNDSQKSSIDVVNSSVVRSRLNFRMKKYIQYIIL